MAEGPVIHIVDDEETVRSSLAFLLSASGWNVRTYASARSLLDHAPGLEGCLITDLRMPDMDGIELLRQLSATGATLPAIVMTGHGEIQAAIEAIRAGAADFIEKPFSQEVLFGSISRTLETASAPPPPADIQRRLASLDELEDRVLRQMVQGQSGKSIAAELGVTTDAVSRCVEQIMLKMEADGLAHLIRLVGQAGPDRDES